MSVKGQSQQSLNDTKQPMMSGEEPTELLLQLVWSALETLAVRGRAKVFVGKGAVAIFLHQTELVPHLGLVPTEKEVLAVPLGDRQPAKNE